MTTIKGMPKERMMSDTGYAHDEYLQTVDRLEQNIHMVDAGAYYASAAISLKRIADSLEWIVSKAKEEEVKNG